MVVVNDERAKSVIFGQDSCDIELLLEDDGVAFNLDPVTVVLGCSTEPPDFARRCALRLEEHGIIGGLDVSQRIANGLLFCVTEVNSREQIDDLIAALEGIH